MKVLCVGEMLIDFLPGNQPGSYIRKAGGAPANVAIALSRQNVESSFCGLVGNDDFGKYLIKTLRENNVEICIKNLTNKATTTISFVSLDDDGNRSFTFARKPGADMLLSREMIKDEFIDKSDIIHCGSCSLSKLPASDATIYVMERAHKKSKLVSFDVNYRNVMWEDDIGSAKDAINKILKYVDFLKLSDEEVDLVGGKDNLINIMEENGISLVVETLGAKGARCIYNGKEMNITSLETTCVDSCGAGDAFWGSFLACILRHNVKNTSDLNEIIIKEALECGNVAGWLCVQKKGAIESLPTEVEVKSIRSKFYN